VHAADGAGLRGAARVALQEDRLDAHGGELVDAERAGEEPALDHHIDRLAEDHEKARVFADAIRVTPGLSLASDIVETNIVIFEVAPQLGTAAELVAKLREKGVLMNAAARQRIRAVTHLDVSLDQVARAAKLIADVAK